MPTQNRRVAAYLPEELSDRLEVFKAERGLKADSSALIAILSEYFRLDRRAAHEIDYSSFVTQQQFQDLVDRVAAFTEAPSNGGEYDVRNELLDRLQQLESRVAALESSKS